MEPISIIAAALGVAWASGINLYAAIVMLGVLGTTGSVELPTNLEVLQHPGVIAAAAMMYFIEFFADKIPGVDSAWDAVHTFIRIPAGALLAGAALSELSPHAELIGNILGGGLAAGSHFTKAGTRVLINASPEPFSNWTASITEDVMVVGGLWAAMNHPILFIVLLVVLIALTIWLAPKIWRGVKKIFTRLRGWFQSSKRSNSESNSESNPEAEQQSNGRNPSDDL